MPWWAWAIVGLTLFIGEMLLPLDFFLIFIGFACLMTGGLVYAEVLGPPWLHWTTTAILSIVFLYFFRPRLVAYLHRDSTKFCADLPGDTLTVKSLIVPGEQGQGEARGSVWTVRNASEADLVPGQRYRVASRDGLTLVVSSAEPQ